MVHQVYPTGASELPGLIAWRSAFIQNTRFGTHRCFEKYTKHKSTLVIVILGIQHVSHLTYWLETWRQKTSNVDKIQSIYINLHLNQYYTSSVILHLSGLKNDVIVKVHTRTERGPSESRASVSESVLDYVTKL